MPRVPLPMADRYADMAFPLNGIDLSAGFGVQRPFTTRVGTNVVTFEPSTDRARGGSRPGLDRFVAGQVPGGTFVIQGLGVVVRASADALLINLDPDDPDPVSGLPPIDDPSSPGPPSSWGTGTLYPGATGTTLQTRVPPGTQVRQGGSGVATNKNVRVPAPSDIERRCFRGLLQVQIVKPPPDPFGWNAQRPAFVGSICELYFPPVALGPTSAFAFPSITSQLNTFIEEHVGQCTFLTIRDEVSAPGAVCTSINQCPP